MEDTTKSRLQIYEKLRDLLSSDETTYEQIEQSLKLLKDQGNQDDADNIDKILKIASIKFGQTQTVLSKLEQDKTNNPFMYVYALHNLGKQDQALTNYNQLNINQKDYHSNMLQAQILYKLDEREKAQEIYRTLIGSKDKHLEKDLNEVLTNLIASIANVNNISEKDIKEYEEKIGGEVLSDLIFNTSCAYSTVEGSEKTAAKKLKESYQIAEENEESGSIKFPILASCIIAKILSKTSNITNIKLAESKIEQLEPKSFDSSENEVLYLNNLAWIKSYFGSIEKEFSELASSIPNVLKSKDLNKYQREVLFFNLLHINLFKGKISDVRKTISEIEKSEHNISEESLNRLKVALLLIERKSAEAIDLVKQPKSIHEALIRSQIQISTGKIELGIRELIQYCKDTNVTNSSVLSFLLKASIDNKMKECKQLVIDLAMENLPKLSKDVLSLIGHILIEEKDFEHAFEVFNWIKDNTDDLKVKAGYLSALAEKDVKKATDYFDKINFDLTDYENEEELHELIDSALAPKSEAKKSKKKVDEEVKKTEKGAKIFIPKARTNKKIKYPKNFDPLNPGPLPDPERWIPKWQRSKGKKKLKLRGPQGDVKNIGVHSKKEFSTANIEASTGSGGGRRKK